MTPMLARFYFFCKKWVLHQMGRRGRLWPAGEGRPAGLAGPKAKWAGKARRAESGK
jgi:hypothetical protein